MILISYGLLYKYNTKYNTINMHLRVLFPYKHVFKSLQNFIFTPTLLRLNVLLTQAGLERIFNPNFPIRFTTNVQTITYRYTYNFFFDIETI